MHFLRTFNCPNNSTLKSAILPWHYILNHYYNFWHIYFFTFCSVISLHCWAVQLNTWKHFLLWRSFSSQPFPGQLHIIWAWCGEPQSQVSCITPTSSPSKLHQLLLWNHCWHLHHSPCLHLVWVLIALI